MAIQKSNQSEQLCRVGAQNGPNHSPTLTNLAVAPLADTFGRLIVVVDESGGQFQNTNTQLRFDSPMDFSTGQTKGMRVDHAWFSDVSTFVHVSGYNADPSRTLFVQLWTSDQQSLTAPGAAVQCKVIIPVPPNFTAFSYGQQFSNKPFTAAPFRWFFIGISTTEFVFTSAGNFLWYSLSFYSFSPVS